MAIVLKTTEQIQKMRAAGRIVHKVLERCREVCKPGVTTKELDAQAYRTFADTGAKGLFKNYPTYRAGEGFPSNLCISINDQVVHGIAGDRVIKDGDVVSCDCGVSLDGWCGDAATTILVGNVAPGVRKLCEVTEHLLELAVENVRPGRRWSQVARLMQNYAEAQGYSVVEDFVGHGIGQTMHEEPKVPNFFNAQDPRQRRSDDFELREGVVLAIEPMCNLGSKDVRTLADQWTVVTVDGKASAHYEHTVAVTAKGCQVLTDGK